MSLVNSHFKLINETNKMIRELISSSSKDINRPNIEYIIFHKHGVCAALRDPCLTNGEILILSRYLNLVFSSNIITLSDLTNAEFGKLLLSLLSGLKLHKSHYFWTTTLGIFNQPSAIEFLIQSIQMMKEVRDIVTDPSPEAVNIVRSTIINLSDLTVKLLDNIQSNIDNVNITVILIIGRISCYLVMYLLDERGLSGQEIKSIVKHLYNLSPMLKSKSIASNSSLILKEEVFVILKKLSSDYILNLIPELIVFINHFLPYIALHFDQSGIIQSLCKSCNSMLQRTADPQESVNIITIAGDIVNIGSAYSHTFLHNEANVKALMGFIKILPNSVEHSYARNILWWHILCSLQPNTFENRFKTYFVPFLENLLGVYLDRNNVSYGISEFNLNNGYMHLSQLADHVITNILDIIKIDANRCIEDNAINNVAPVFVHVAKLKSEAFTTNIMTSSENMTLLFNAVEIWTEILKREQKLKLQTTKFNALRNKPKKLKKRKLKMIKKRYGTKLDADIHEKCQAYINDSQITRPFPSHSSDDTSITLISRISQENSTRRTMSEEKDSNNTLIPEISTRPLVKTQSIDDVIKGNISKFSKTSEKLLDLKNIIKFFKFRTSDNHSNITGPERLVLTAKKSLSVTDQKKLPLKKRKLERDSDGHCNETIKTQPNRCAREPSKVTTSRSDSTLDMVSTDGDSSTIRNRHKYFIRSNPYGLNDKIVQQQFIPKLSGTGKISKSNVDFSVNVSESCKENKIGDKNNKNNSKKVEFKIKIDLNPLSKICSDGIKLDIVKNKSKRNQSSMCRSSLIKS